MAAKNQSSQQIIRSMKQKNIAYFVFMAATFLAMPMVSSKPTPAETRKEIASKNVTPNDKQVQESRSIPIYKPDGRFSSFEQKPIII